MSLIKKIGSAFGKAFLKIGKKLGSKKMQEIGEHIIAKCAEIGQSDSYERGYANTDTVENLSSLLAEIKDDALDADEDIEEACAEEVEVYFDSLIDQLKKAPENEINKTNLREIEANKKQTVRSVRGSLCKPLSKELSLSNTECCEILRMEAGSDKTAKIEAFVRKANRKSLASLAKEVKKSLNKATNDVVEYLENLCEEKRNEITNQKNHYDELLSDNELEQGKLEEKCVDSLLITEAAEQVFGILES